jgi:hypothetical protein
VSTRSTPVGSGTQCTSDNNECTDDECDGAGQCVNTIDTTNTCGSQTTTVCTNPDFCDPNGVCQPNNVECAFVTSSSLCPFDVDPDACGPGNTDDQFRLLFTPDVKNWIAYKHNASNPGQYYYNLFYDGTPNSTATLAITVPYPFVTQGAMPLHVYDGLLVDTADSNGQDDCFILPDTALAASDLDITLDDYDGTADGGSLLSAVVTCTDLTAQCTTAGAGGLDDVSADANCVISVDVPIPASGQVYVNLHLDWGLKGGRTDANPCDEVADRYDAGTQYLLGGWDALENTDTDDGPIAIANCNDFAFSHTDGVDGFGDSVQNINEFKRINGAFGTANGSFTGNPAAQGTPLALIRNSTGEIVGTGETDEDGFWAVPYKHKGKAAWYTVWLLGQYDLLGHIELKGGSGWGNVDFDVDTETYTAEWGTGGSTGGGGGGKGKK